MFVALLGGFVTWALTTCFAEPPALATRPAILDLEVEVVNHGASGNGGTRGNGGASESGGRRRLGNSWFEQRPGHSMLYVEGEPFEIGYANSMLTADLLEHQERALMTTVRTFLPNKFALYSAALMVLVHNRNLPEFVPDEYKVEIYGLSHNRAIDPYPQFGDRYHRILNYHAAHDISHWIFDTPSLGCTSFAASGARTANGHLLVGRNFDWESGEHFDSNKVIALYRPTKGHAFLSVAWPGMAGAVTGLNAAKIFCSINGAHTEHMGLGVGRPVSLVVRQILQYADDLDDAVEIVRNAPVFVADSYLCADGKTGRAIVIEKTPKSSAVRQMHQGVILQSNHFETEALRKDTGNLRYLRDGTSLQRRQRLRELLSRFDGKLSPPIAAKILRDRRGPGDAERGLGHRGTLNAMIATHSVVADVTTGTLWVSRGPHQLGQFDPYAIQGFGDGRPPGTTPIPEDPERRTAYADLVRYRQLRGELEAAVATGSPLSDAQRNQLKEAQRLNPHAPEIHHLVGQDLLNTGDREGALQSFRRALAAAPAFRPDRDATAALVQRLTREKASRQ